MRGVVGSSSVVMRGCLVGNAGGAVAVGVGTLRDGVSVVSVVGGTLRGGAGATGGGVVVVGDGSSLSGGDFFGWKISARVSSACRLVSVMLDIALVIGFLSRWMMSARCAAMRSSVEAAGIGML